MNKTIENISVLGGCYHNGLLCFFSTEIKALCSINVDDGMLDVMYPIVDLEDGKEFIDVVFYDGSLILVPYNHTIMYIYNTEKKRMEKYSLESFVTRGFSKAFLRDNELVLIPHNIKEPIVFFDIESETINTMKILTGKIDDPNDDDTWIDPHGMCLYGDYCYITCRYKNTIVKWNLKDNRQSFYNLKSDVSIRGICAFKEKMWFSLNGNAGIMSWDESSKEELLHRIPDQMTGNWLFVQNVPIDDKTLMILPGFANRVYTFNVLNGKWNELSCNFPKEFRRTVSKRSLFHYYTRLGQKIYLYPRSGNGILVYDICNNVFSMTMIKAEQHCAKELKNLEMAKVNGVLSQDGIITENSFAGADLRNFLEYIDNFHS